VIIQTRTGDFALESSSGGMMALMEVGWQVFLRGRNSPSFTVCFDEPENHLHPELQRHFLPRLLAAFPNVQFIIATHSPLVCSSEPESNVYVLRYDERRQVNSELLDMINKGGSAAEILRDVLDLPTTFPTWVEARLGEVVSKYTRAELTRADFAALRQDLVDLGLGDLAPTALVEVLDRQKDRRDTAEQG
jgi:hypothetical protein